MKANELLFWLSARRQGSWQQFRAAVEELHSSDNDSTGNEMTTGGEDEFPLHQQLRLDLERLAHVEFFAQGCEEGWHIAPPTFAMHPVQGRVRAVLCGARSPALRERVLRIGERMDCETIDSRGAPEVIRLVASDMAILADLATQAGVLMQSDAPLAILSHLPPCDPPSRRRSLSEFPQGADWIIYKFNTRNLRGARSNALTRRICALVFCVSLFTSSDLGISSAGKEQLSNCHAPLHSIRL